MREQYLTIIERAAELAEAHSAEGLEASMRGDYAAAGRAYQVAADLSALAFWAAVQS